MDICKKADFMTPATMAQDGTLVRTLTSYVWVDWALLPLSTRNLRLQGIQYSQGKILLTKCAGYGNGPLRGIVDAIRVFNPI